MVAKNKKRPNPGNRKRVGQGEEMISPETRVPLWRRRVFTVPVAFVAFLGSAIGVGQFGTEYYDKNFGFKSHGVYQYKGLDSKFEKPLFGDLAKTASGETLDFCRFHYNTGREQYIDEALQSEINNPKNQSILLLRKAEAYFQKNDFPTTLSLVDKALSLYPGNVNALEVSIGVRRKVLLNLVKCIPARPTPQDSGIIQKAKELANEIEALEERLRVFDPSDYRLLGHLFLNKHEAIFDDDLLGYSLLNSENNSPAGRINLVRKPKLTYSYGLYDSFLGDPRFQMFLNSTYVDILATRDDGSSSLKVISIGVDNYANSELVRSLDFAASDAENVTRSLASYGFDVKLLKNKEATSINIANVLSKEVLSSKPGDTLVLYVSSHGLADYNGNKYIMTYVDRDKKAQLMSVKSIESLLSAHKGDAYVLIDSCFDRFKFSGSDVFDKQVELSIGKKPMLILGSSLGEKAIESKQLKSGLFTYALIEYLEKHKGTTAGEVDFIGMSDYVKRRTSYLAHNLYGLKQTPDVSLSNQ